MKKFTLAAASALTLALAMPLVAQAGGHKGGGPQLEKFDTNADGAITRAEAEVSVLTAFADIDANSDGLLSQDELKTAREAHRAEMMAKWEERRAGKEPREPKGDRDPAKMEARKAKMETKAAERFAAVDTDGDGQWNKTEFTAHRLEFFGKVDTDADGTLSAAELEAAKAKMKERRGKWRNKPAEQ